MSVIMALDRWALRPWSYAMLSVVAPLHAGLLMRDLVFELDQLGIVSVSLAAALRLDGISLARCGLPLDRTGLRLLSGGVLLAFGAVMVLVAITAALGAYRIDGLQYGLVGSVRVEVIAITTYLATGLAEELWFRSYPLTVLTGSTGFLPASLVTSALFGLWHVASPGVNWQAVIMIAGAGLSLCLLRWLTGSLWFGIGSHATWDYLNSAFGLDGAGSSRGGHLFNARLQGPDWLTGGGAGMESSLLGGVIELLLLIIPLAWFLPQRLRAR
ncbi:CPBP family intramembrane glutamic endopeptidase [Lichenicoccus sp.]|uniref:CPBP family intramembrane glutamic endopeptidase n=1 Tax=Lichenicoccus sp. TaxID=2781899 RepID=UPI003D0F9657